MRKEVSMGSFTMLMRLRYLEGKLPQEGKSAIVEERCAAACVISPILFLR
jgi:hypothetical protein